MWQLSFYVIKRFQFMYSANLLFGKRVLWWTLFFLCLIGLSGATSALVGATPDGNVAETPTSAPPKHSPDEQHWAAVFESPRPLAQDWRQYAASDAIKPELQTPARIVLESVKTPLTEHTGILLLTLQANNIQVRETWRVSNSMRAFTVSNNGELYLTGVNQAATFVATVYLIDNFQVLNKAYQNLTASAVITVDVMSGDLSAEQPPRLEVVEGMAKEVYVFEANGGDRPYTYTLLENPEENPDDAFTFSNGTLAVNANATSGVYRFTVEVADADNMLVTVAATVEVRGKQIFVLGGFGGFNLNDVWFSADGANWRRETANAEWARREEHQALSHNGRLYVLGGLGNNLSRLNDVWSSADGKNWSLETSNAEWSRRSRHRALSHNGRLYVLGGIAGSNLNDVWSSADGKNWEEETDDAEWAGRYSHQAVSHNGRLYVLGGVAGSNLNDVWSSADGQNWEEETDDTEWAGRWGHQAVSHNGRLYVLGGYDGSNLNDVWSSADGKNWVLEETAHAKWAGRYNHQALSHSGRFYVLGGNDGDPLNDVWSSADGKNWSLEIANANWTRRSNHQAVVFPSPLALLGVGERLTATAGIAADLHTFTAQYGRGGYSYSLGGDIDGFSVNPSGVLSTDNAVAGGLYTLTVWVQDGTGDRAQTAVKVFVSYLNLAEVPLLAGLAGVANVLHIFTTDGGIAGEQYTIVAGNKEYFALDADSGVLSLLTTALEGVYTLSVEVSDSTNSLNRATVAVTVNIGGGRIFILGGYDDSNRLNDVWSSADGTNWRRETDDAGWTERSVHQALLHNGRLYVLGGDDGSNRLNDVWSSADGKNWSRETANANWTGRWGHQALSHSGRFYVLGGYDGAPLNDVWSSADGKNWSLEDDAEWAGRYWHQALSHNGRLYVLGGYDDNYNFLNDVWSSADGKNWSLETDNAGWAKGSDHQAVSHNGRIYVLGGLSEDDDFLNDVWSSADGKNWSRETANAKWAGRYGHQALLHNGRFYVLGGHDGDDALNDVWSSADGKNWEEETANANWPIRYDHQAVVFH